MPQYKKKSFPQEKLFSSLWFRHYSLIIFGSLLVAIGYNFFIMPHKLVPGGVFGFSIILNQLIGFPVGSIALCINIPLLAWGIKVLGGKFGIKTILAMVLGSVFIDGLTYLCGNPIITKDLLVSSMFGGAIIGLGIGLVVSAGATTGGTDIIARIFSKWFRVSLGQMFITIDGLIVLSSIVVFKNIDLAPYCIIAILCISKTVDAVLMGIDAKKAALIISEKHEEIRDKILKMDRGGTYIKGEGLFYKNQKKIIFTALNRKELGQLESFVKGIDPEAFIATLNTNDVYGNGFKPIQ
ncbi:YitT family protein [Marinifilum sp. RC60d5]|uniref:YitT family protein n=1 Tax=Marinifilum sp. RC60d5 TaxID=3458414 RepID=UPI004036F85D